MMHTEEWIAGKTYKAGDTVTFQGRRYKAIQGHTSQSDWIPASTPALWGIQPNIENRSPYASYQPPLGPPPGRSPQDHDFGGPPPPWTPPRPFHDNHPNPSFGFGGPPMPPTPSFPSSKTSPPPRPVPVPVPVPSFPGPFGFPGSGFNSPPIVPPRPDQSPGFGPPMPGFNAFPQADRSPRNESRGGLAGGQVRFDSSESWIRDAKARTEDLKRSGPKGPTTWVLVMDGVIPPYAIPGGHTPDGQPLFVARNFHEGGLHIGWASHDRASLSWGGAEIPLTTYEVLTGDSHSITWAPAQSGSSGGARPLEAGHEADGKPLWICQARLEGGVIPGKTAGWDTGAYVTLNGIENQIMDYNVLVHK